MWEKKNPEPEKFRLELVEQSLSREQLLIAKYIQTVTFPRRLRGVDELAVWKAMEKLIRLYEDALTVERSRRELAQRKLEAIRFREEAGQCHETQA